jgi:hypothetical protein
MSNRLNTNRDWANLGGSGEQNHSPRLAESELLRDGDSTESLAGSPEILTYQNSPRNARWSDTRSKTGLSLLDSMVPAGGIEPTA